MSDKDKKDSALTKKRAVRSSGGEGDTVEFTPEDQDFGAIFQDFMETGENETSPEADDSAEGKSPEGSDDDFDSLFGEAVPDGSEKNASAAEEGETVPLDEEMKELSDVGLDDTGEDTAGSPEPIEETEPDEAMSGLAELDMSAGDEILEMAASEEDEVPNPPDIPTLEEEIETAEDKPAEPILSRAVADDETASASSTTFEDDKDTVIMESSPYLNSQADTATDSPQSESESSPPAAPSSLLPIGALILALAGTATGGFALWKILQTPAMMQPAPVQTAVAPQEDPRVREIEAALSNLTSRIQTVETAAMGIDSDQTQRNEQAIASIEQQLTDLNGTIDELKESIAGIEKQFSELSQKAQQPAQSVPSETGWIVNVASFTRSAAADKTQARLQKNGVETIKRNVTHKGRNLYRLSVLGFSDKKAALEYIWILKTKKSITGAWLEKASADNP